MFTSLITNLKLKSFETNFLNGNVKFDETEILKIAYALIKNSGLQQLSIPNNQSISLSVLCAVISGCILNPTVQWLSIPSALLSNFCSAEILYWQHRLLQRPPNESQKKAILYKEIINYFSFYLLKNLGEIILDYVGVDVDYRKSEQFTLSMKIVPIMIKAMYYALNAQEKTPFYKAVFTTFLCRIDDLINSLTFNKENVIDLFKMTIEKSEPYKESEMKDFRSILQNSCSLVCGM